jgi:hypothetical protein
MDGITTIQVRKSTRDRLASMGRKNETYDEIINKLLDKCGRQQRLRL